MKRCVAVLLLLALMFALGGCNLISIITGDDTSGDVTRREQKYQDFRRDIALDSDDALGEWTCLFDYGTFAADALKRTYGLAVTCPEEIELRLTLTLEQSGTFTLRTENAEDALDAFDKVLDDQLTEAFTRKCEAAAEKEGLTPQQAQQAAQARYGEDYAKELAKTLSGLREEFRSSQSAQIVVRRSGTYSVNGSALVLTEKNLEDCLKLEDGLLVLQDAALGELVFGHK